MLGQAARCVVSAVCFSLSDGNLDVDTDRPRLLSVDAWSLRDALYVCCNLPKFVEFVGWRSCEAQNL